MLHALAEAGEQVLDLEGLASHRGSAFGALGLPPQPSHREFQRRVRESLALRRILGRCCGSRTRDRSSAASACREELQRAIASAPVVVRHAPVSRRVNRLTETYGDAPTAELRAALERTARRLGEAAAERAATHLERGDVRAAVCEVLPYYDTGYRRRTERHRRTVIGHCRD